MRIQLEEAQQTLALRKEYDELAEKITSNRLLRPREDQHANLAKLEAEIADLERESEDYAQTWAERRQQFGRIIDEGMQLRKLIRDEKEEVERKEGMEGREDGEDEHERRSARSGGGTPHRDMEGTTPIPQEVGTPAGLGVEREGSARGKSPLCVSQGVEDGEEGKKEEVDDEEMAEDGELEAESEGVVAAPADGLVAADHKDDEMAVGEAGNQMDTS